MLLIFHNFIAGKGAGLVFCYWKFNLFFLDLLYPEDTKLKMCECFDWTFITITQVWYYFMRHWSERKSFVSFYGNNAWFNDLCCFKAGKLLEQRSVTPSLKSVFSGNRAFSLLLLGSTFRQMRSFQQILVQKNTNNRYRALLGTWKLCLPSQNSNWSHFSILYLVCSLKQGI